MKLRPSVMMVVYALALLAGMSHAWAQPFGYAINSRGDFPQNDRVFALWRVNLATGAEEYIGWTGAGIIYIDIEGLAFSPGGQLHGTDDATNTLLRISTNTGNATPVGGERHNMGLPLSEFLDFGLTFTCEGDLLASSATQQRLYHADRDTGQLEAVGDLGAPVADMAARGDVIYGIGVGTDAAGAKLAPRLYRIDPAGPSVSVIGELGAAVAPYNNAGLDFDQDGVLWAITDRRDVGGQDAPSQILRIDVETGAAQVVAETIVGIESLAIGPPGGCGDDPVDPGPNPRGEDELAPVPVLGVLGTGVLVLMLLLAGMAGLRRP